MIQSQPGQEISLPPTSPGTFPLTESLLGMETQISFQLKKLSSDCSKGFFPSSAAAPRRRFFFAFMSFHENEETFIKSQLQSSLVCQIEAAKINRKTFNSNRCFLGWWEGVRGGVYIELYPERESRRFSRDGKLKNLLSR